MSQPEVATRYVSSSKLAGYVLAVVAAISFACSLVLARVSYDYGSDPQSVLVVRFGLLMLLLLGWNLSQKKSLALPPKRLFGSLLVGLSYFIGIGSYLSSVAYMPVSLAVLIFYTFPIIITLLSAVVERRWPHPLQMLALLIAFTGLMMALDVETTGMQTIGLVFAVLASLGVSVNMLASGYLLKYVPTTVFSLYMSLGTLALSLLVMFWQGGLALPASGEGQLYFAGMLLFFFSGYLATYNGIRLLGAVPMSTIMNLEPITTILVAFVLLGEVLSMHQLWGGMIVIAGILIAQWPQIRQLRNRRRSATTPPVR